MKKHAEKNERNIRYVKKYKYFTIEKGLRR